MLKDSTRNSSDYTEFWLIREFLFARIYLHPKYKFLKTTSLTNQPTNKQMEIPFDGDDR